MPTISGTPALVNRWRLSGTVGATTLDCYVMVPSSYTWQSHVDAVKMIDPCTGIPTILRGLPSGTTGPYFGRPVMHVEGANRAAVVAELFNAWKLGGPWTLATPTESLTVVADPTQGDFSKQNFGDHWEVSFGWQATS